MYRKYRKYKKNRKYRIFSIFSKISRYFPTLVNLSSKHHCSSHGFSKPDFRNLSEPRVHWQKGLTWNYLLGTDHFDFRWYVVLGAGYVVRAAGKHDGDGWWANFTEISAETMVRDTADRQCVNTGHVAITAAVISNRSSIAGCPHKDWTLTTTTL